MIFDTTEIDNQIAALQEERDRKAELNLAVTKALASLADLIGSLEDEDAIANLKSEVLALFTPEPSDTTSVVATSEPDAVTLPQPEPEETISDRVQQETPYYQLTPTSNPSLAYLKRRDGQLGCCYIGGMNQATLDAWGHWLHHNGYIPNPPTLREAKRLGNWQYELKLPPMSREYLEELVTIDYARYPGVPTFIHQPHRVDPWCELAA